MYKKITEKWIKENMYMCTKIQAQQILEKHFPGYWLEATKNSKAFIYDDQGHIVASIQL